MRLEARKYLHDIERAAKLLAEFTSGKVFVDYERDAMLRAASSANSRSSARRFLAWPSSTKP